MPTTLVSQLPPHLPPEMARAQWTREECAELERLGFLERERFELIDGELVRKMSKSPIHFHLVAALLESLRDIFSSKNVLQEAPIDPSGDLSSDLSRRNEPEPDALVLRRPWRELKGTNARPGDIALLLEVAVTSAAYHLGAKAALYATAGIEDYWVLDVAARRIVVHRKPAGAIYTSIASYTADEPVSPLAAPEASIRLADLLPE
jgi:Uma2 family endonuclease